MKTVLTLLTIFTLLTTIKAQETSDEQYMNAFIVISDTSPDYYLLKEKMILLSDSLNLEIDTLGRLYNKEKNLICLPEDSEDELYAGEYYPRRYPSESMSLEYLESYRYGLKMSKTIALMVMITDDKTKAEEKLKQIIDYSKDAFIINTKLFMGCMH